MKNLIKQPRVKFSVGTRSEQSSAVSETPALARAVRDEDDPPLTAAVKALMQNKYGWSDGLIVELRKLD